MNKNVEINSKLETVNQQESIFNYDKACAEIKSRTLYPFGNNLGVKNILAISGIIILFLFVSSLFLGATTLIVHKIFNNTQGYVVMALTAFLIVLYAFVEYKTEKHHIENGIPTNTTV